MKYDLADALQSLKPGAEWVLRRTEYSGLEWLDESQTKQTEDEAEITNGLENFEIEEETPELFNSEVEENLSYESSAETKEADNLDEDDLEIPAFLRRQKN